MTNHRRQLVTQIKGTKVLTLGTMGMYTQRACSSQLLYSFGLVEWTAGFSLEADDVLQSIWSFKRPLTHHSLGPRPFPFTCTKKREGERGKGLVTSLGLAWTVECEKF